MRADLHGRSSDELVGQVKRGAMGWSKQRKGLVRWGFTCAPRWTERHCWGARLKERAWYAPGMRQGSESPNCAAAQNRAAARPNTASTSSGGRWGAGRRGQLPPGAPHLLSLSLSFTSASCTFSLLLLLLEPASDSPIFITACCRAWVLALISCGT